MLKNKSPLQKKLELYCSSDRTKEAIRNHYQRLSDSVRKQNEAMKLSANYSLNDGPLDPYTKLALISETTNQILSSQVDEAAYLIHLCNSEVTKSQAEQRRDEYAEMVGSLGDYFKGQDTLSGNEIPTIPYKEDSSYQFNIGKLGAVIEKLE